MKTFGKKQLDMFLFIAAIVIFAFFIIARFFKTPIIQQRTDLNVSSRLAEIFGEDIAKNIINEYEAENPHMRIHLIDQTGEIFPDVVFFDDDLLSDLALQATSQQAAESQSMLASLDPYMYSGDQTESAQLALPLVAFVDLFFYNIDILAAAGRVRPPKTRAELLETAKAVAAAGKENIFPLALSLSADSTGGMSGALRRELYPWIWADGPEILDRGSLSRSSANTITFMNQLNREGLLAPGIFERTSLQNIEEFAEGKLAMMAASSMHIPYLQKKNINFNVTAFPSTAPGKNRLGISRIYTGISAASALQDEAWAFLNLIAGKTQLLAHALNAVPGIYPVNFPGDYIAENDLLSKAWEIFEAAEIVNIQTFSPAENEAARLVSERIFQVMGN